jgi:hypothetical protein
MPVYRFKSSAKITAETAIGEILGNEVESTEMDNARKQYDILFNETAKVFGFVINNEGQVKIIDEEGQNYIIENESNNNTDDERINEILALILDALEGEIEQVVSGGRRRKGSRSSKNTRKTKNSKRSNRSRKARKQNNQTRRRK